MSTTPPASVPPSGDDRNLVQVDETYLAPSFEDKVQQFWAKNRAVIIGVCALVFVVIVARGAMAWWQKSQAAALSAAYAEVKDDAGLQAFADAHSGTQLAGVALLRLGDSAYNKGDFNAAAKHYEAARDELADTVFSSRLNLGLAVVKLKSGATDAGRAALQALADDATAVPAVRAEAAYHLASLAAKDGDNETVSALATRITSIAPGSSWSQRAMILLTTLPASTGTTTNAPGEAPAISFPGTP